MREEEAEEIGFERSTLARMRSRRILPGCVAVAASAMLAIPMSAGAATFVVSRGDDPAPDGCASGSDCSLREAVDAANAAGGLDTIQLGLDVALNRAGSDDTNVAGDLDVAAGGGPLELVGTGTSRAIVTQDASDRIVDVAAGAGLTVRNISLRSGALTGSARGAGIRFQANSTALTLDDAELLGNVADTGPGGGVWVGGSSATLSVLNESEMSLNSSGLGGAIGMGGPGTNVLTIADSELTDNDADAEGGAVWVDALGAFDIDVEDSSFDENSAGGGGVNGVGGAMSVINESASASIDIDGSEMSGNSAGGGGGSGSGGALYLAEFDPMGNPQASSLAIRSSVLDSNQAGGNAGAGRGTGGAIGANGWDVEIAGTTISQNDAGVSVDASTPSGTGGGVAASGDDAEALDIAFTLLTGNQAGEAAGGSSDGGGAVTWIGDGDLTIADSEITANTAGTTATGPGGANGGGIMRFTLDASAADSIVRSTISGNSLTSPAAGASGGGLYFSTGGRVDINASTIAGNTVTGATTGRGGGATLLSVGSQAAFSILNSTIHANRSLGPGGGFAGGILLSAATGTGAVPSSIVHSTITSNEAQVGSTGGTAGNLYLTSGATQLRGTIIAAGIGFVAPGPAENNCNLFQPDQYVSLGENIEDSSPSQCDFGAGDQIGVDPLLGPLAPNGQSPDLPLTRALLPGSPALDSVPPGGLCPATDQRGLARPQGAACDAGAFELGVPVVQPPDQPPLVPGPDVSKPPKCKKGKKLKKGKCVKKKRKKK